MLTTLSRGTVLAFRLTGLITGAFTRSANVKGSPILMSFCTQPGGDGSDQAEKNVNSPDVRGEIQIGTLMSLMGIYTSSSGEYCTLNISTCQEWSLIS